MLLTMTPIGTNGNEHGDNDLPWQSQFRQWLLERTTDSNNDSSHLAGHKRDLNKHLRPALFGPLRPRSGSRAGNAADRARATLNRGLRLGVGLLLAAAIWPWALNGATRAPDRTGFHPI